MKINNVKELQTLLKCLRKEGITHYKTPEMELVLGSLPSKATKSIMEEIFPEERIEIPKYNGELPAEVAPPEKIKTDELTEEQLLNWSVANEPGSEA